MNSFFALITNNHGLAGRIFLNESSEGPQVSFFDTGRALYFDGHLTASQDKINFQAGFCSPEIDWIIQFIV
jgi:hypothetical protein